MTHASTMKSKDEYYNTLNVHVIIAAVIVLMRFTARSRIAASCCNIQHAQQSTRIVISASLSLARLAYVCPARLPAAAGPCGIGFHPLFASVTQTPGKSRYRGCMVGL